MKRIFIVVIVNLIGLFAFGQSQKDTTKITYEELLRKIRVQDSLREIEIMTPILEAFNKEKRKYLGKTYYLKKGSKLYKKGSPFKCVALDIDKWLNATISLVNKGDTLTMPVNFSEGMYQISLTEDFKSLFSSGSVSSTPKEKTNYRLVAKTLYIGMSSKSVLYLMGRPKDIRTTVAENIEYEFWEYPDKVFLSFLNGKLKVIQIL